MYTLSNTGAYGEHGPTTVGLSGHKSIPLYTHSLEAFRFAYDVVYTNHQSAGEMCIRDRVVGLEKKADTRPIYAMAAPELLEKEQVLSLIHISALYHAIPKALLRTRRFFLLYVYIV